MFVSGFTFVRNAIKYDYPIVEAILSILPVCDEVVIAVGKSEDATLALIQGIASPKIRIIETIWDDSLREGGRVLADETNKALAAISPKADWAFYIQGDEVFPESDIAAVYNAMQKHAGAQEVEGLLFKYRHFYGSYDYIGISRRWYSHEIRVVRPQKGLSSYRDAQGFRVNGRKLNVIPVNAYIHHYGWVKHPQKQQEKQRNFHKMWHDDTWMKEKIPDVDAFDYSQIDILEKFTGQHPEVMKNRIAAMNWKFSFDPLSAKWTLKSKLLYRLEKALGIRPFEYRNYVKIQNK